jgi:hypothetical protein
LVHGDCTRDEFNCWVGDFMCDPMTTMHAPPGGYAWYVILRSSNVDRVMIHGSAAYETFKGMPLDRSSLVFTSQYENVLTRYVIEDEILNRKLEVVRCVWAQRCCASCGICASCGVTPLR